MFTTERKALDKLAEAEALSAAAVIRRLVIIETRERGLWPTVREACQVRDAA